MSKGTIIWIINLALLLVLELIAVFSVGKINGPFNQDTAMQTYKVPTQSIQIDPTTGKVGISEEADSTLSHPELPPGLRPVASILPIIFVIVIVLGAVSFMARAGE